MLLTLSPTNVEECFYHRIHEEEVFSLNLFIVQHKK